MLMFKRKYGLPDYSMCPCQYCLMTNHNTFYIESLQNKSYGVNMV